MSINGPGLSGSVAATYTLKQLDSEYDQQPPFQLTFLTLPEAGTARRQYFPPLFSLPLIIVLFIIRIRHFF